MKNILTVIVAATAFFNINAETLTLTPGSISAGIAADAAPAELIIKGEIDIRDFDYIRDNFWRTLRTLDLSEARIAAYEGEPTLTGVSKSEADVLPDGALMLGSLTELMLPATLKAIGDGALASTAVKEIVIPATVEKIGTSAFANCNSLESVVLPAAVKTLGANAFADCGALKSADISAAALQEVPAGAFARCAALADVTLPSVAEIGASAFAGCAGIKSVIMGAHVQNIGEMAFDTCPVADVYITAPTAPAAFDNTFSNYTGTLHVQSSEALSLYSGSNACWNKFSNFKVMEVPGDIEFDVETVEGEHGVAYQINASFSGVTVTLPWLFFRSSNPEVATVDENGLITLTANKNEGAKVRVSAYETAPEGKTSTITILSLYANGPVAKFEISDTGDVSGITDILSDNNTAGEIDYQMPYEVYSLNGMQVATAVENLSGGFYIVRQGKIVKKILVK